MREPRRQSMPVDEEAVRRVLERAADSEERRRVWGLIWRFRSWAEAYCRLGVKGGSA